MKLPDELDARLRKESERRGVTLSELVRLAIERLLGVRTGRRLRSLGAGRSGFTDTSRRAEEILREAALSTGFDSGVRRSRHGA